MDNPPTPEPAAPTTPTAGLFNSPTPRDIPVPCAMDRQRVYAIGQNEILEAFRIASTPDELMGAVILPGLGGLPPEAALLAVHYSHERRAFLFYVVHESFEPVPPAVRTPIFPGTLEQRRVAILRESDKVLSI